MEKQKSRRRSSWYRLYEPGTTRNASGNANGNLTTDGTNTYTYDSEQRLLTATGAFGSASYSYDPFGRRLSKTVNGTTTRFLYDGDDLLAETDSAGTLTASYLYGPGIDEPLRMVRGGITSYYPSARSSPSRTHRCGGRACLRAPVPIFVNDTITRDSGIRSESEG